MLKKTGFGLLLFGCLLVAIFFAYRFVTKSDGLGKWQVDGQDASHAVIADDELSKVGFSQSEAPPSLPKVDAVNLRFRQLAGELRKTYRSGGLPARIRIQGELAKLWRSEPPSVESLLNEVREADAPKDHRVYFAKVLRNQIKRRAYDENEFAVAIAGLQMIIESESEEALFRSEVAMILTTVDQSDETIQTVLPLMDHSDDETATRAVSALCNTTSPVAIESLYDFVQDYENLQQAKPLALATALAPLSTVKDYDVVPVIQGVVSSTDDFDLIRTTLQCLMRVPSSQAVIEAIITAYDSSERIPEQTAYIQHLCRVALEQHGKFIQENELMLNQSTTKQLQKIRRDQ